MIAVAEVLPASIVAVVVSLTVTSWYVNPEAESNFIVQSSALPNTSELGNAVVAFALVSVFAITA